jgi:drug/metabolite transporter (DMT)-like permease
VLTATLLSLAAAVLHAGWNLAVKQSGDRLTALWAQFLVAGGMGAVALLIAGGIPGEGYVWAALSGLTHVPYAVFLSRAYAAGDFGVVYPIARGGGALLAGIGGILFLGDRIGSLGFVGLCVVALSLMALSGGARVHRVGDALAVALTIGVYTVCDARGVRVTDTPVYAAASFVASGLFITVACLASGRLPVLRTAVRIRWRQYVVAGAATALTYTLVQIALRRAPVGYVTALRESSVLIAAVAGRRLLGETAGRRRIAAAGGVVVGLVVLVVGR